MKQIEQKKFEIQKSKNGPPSTNSPDYFTVQPYKVKRSFNKGMGFIIVLLMIFSFWAGLKFNSNNLNKLNYFTANSDSINHFKKLNQSTIEKLNYKEIHFDHYIEYLNKQTFTSYEDYLAETRRANDFFEQDMEYNRQTFIASHEILGKDNKAWLDFNHSQRKISVRFREQLEKHKQNFRAYYNTSKKIADFNN